MGQYDGEIRINTKISVAEAKLQLRQFQGELAKLDKTIAQNRKNLTKIAPQLAEYEQKKAMLKEAADDRMSMALNDAERKDIQATYAVGLETLSEEYSDILRKQQEYNTALDTAIRKQEELTGKVQEAQQNLNDAVIAEQKAAQSKKDQVAAEKEQARAAREAAKEEARLAKEAEKASKNLERSASRVGKKILTWGTAMLAVRGVIGILRRSVQAFLSDNENVANQLTAIWSAIGNALGPIIMRIIGLIQTLFAAISAFVKALTGIDLVANYNAKALENQANATAGAGAAAEKAERQLAGFDEMNKLTDTSSTGGGGGGGGGIEMPSLLDDIDNWLTDFATRLGMTVKDVFFDWGTNMTQEDIAQKIITLLGAIGGGAIGFMLGGVPGALVGVVVGTGIALAINALIFDHDGTLSKSEIANMITGALGGIAGGIIGFAVGGPAGALIGATIGLGVTLLLTGIQVTDESGQSEGLLYHIMHDVLGLPSDQEIIGTLNGIGEGFWDLWLKIDEWFLEMDNTVYEAIEDVKEKIFEGIEETWEKITEAASNTKQKISDTVSNAKARTQEMKEDFNKKAQSMREKARETFDNITSSISTAVDNAKQKFEDMKAKVLTVWDIIKSKFTSLGSVIGSAISGAIKTAINNVLSLIQNKINSAVNLINGVIGVINAIPGVSVGYLSPVYLPRLAKGGIVNNPGMGVTAVIGEAGAEAVLPLERNTGWMDTLADKIASRSGAGGQVVVPVYLSGRKIAEYIVDLTTREAFVTNRA